MRITCSHSSFCNKLASIKKSIKVAAVVHGLCPQVVCLTGQVTYLFQGLLTVLNSAMNTGRCVCVCGGGGGGGGVMVYVQYIQFGD